MRCWSRISIGTTPSARKELMLQYQRLENTVEIRFNFRDHSQQSVKIISLPRTNYHCALHQLTNTPNQPHYSNRHV